MAATAITWRKTLTAVAVGVVAHLWLLRAVVQNGDAAVYNQQIQSTDLDGRTTHVGYMTLGWLFNSLSPLELDLTMNLFSLLCAALGAGAAFVISAELSGEDRWSLVAVPAVFSIATYLRGAVLGEVDVPASSFVVCSVALAMRGRQTWAGAVFGLAMLVTPVVATSLPMPLGALAFGASGQARPLRRWLMALSIFGLVALAVYLPVVGLVWQDYFHGGRGLLRAGRNVFDLSVQVRRSAAFVQTNAQAWLPFGLAGVLVSLGNSQARGLAAGLLLALVATAIGADRFLDVPVQLPQVVVLVCFAVAVLSQLSGALRTAALAVVLLLSMPPTYLPVHDEVTRLEQQRDDYRAMARLTPHMLVAGLSDSWDPVHQFEHGLYGKSYLGLGHTWGGFTRNQVQLRLKFKGYAIWLVSRPPRHAFDDFAATYRSEKHDLNGRTYEVWLPK